VLRDPGYDVLLLLEEDLGVDGVQLADRCLPHRLALCGSEGRHEDVTTEHGFEHQLGGALNEVAGYLSWRGMDRQGSDGVRFDVLGEVGCIEGRRGRKSGQAGFGIGLHGNFAIAAVVVGTGPGAGIITPEGSQEAPGVAVRGADVLKEAGECHTGAGLLLLGV
jgi:hypothetical protein